MHHLAPRRSRLRMALAATALAVGFTMVGAGSALAAPAPTITITTTTESAEVGEAVDVAVEVADTTDVFSYAITLTFDPAIFEYTDDSATAGPTGGFDTVVPGDGSVTLVHSRLGTSPTIGGTLPASLSFTTIGSGTGLITASVTLIDSTGTSSVAVLPAVSEPIVVTAVPVPEPTATATPTATPTASPTPSAEPSDAATPAPTATASPTGLLALTGVAGGALLPILVAGILAIALGIVAYRRKIASAR
jgi:hypothetical protein